MVEKRGKVKSKEEFLLWKKPKNVKIIEGFPGLGLVATIATGYLIEHLNCEQIGSFYFEEAAPTLAIHKNNMVDPIGVFYNKEKNLAIIHAITSANGIEWKAAKMIMEIADQLNAKENTWAFNNEMRILIQWQELYKIAHGNVDFAQLNKDRQRTTKANSCAE